MKINEKWRQKIRYQPGDHVGVFAANDQQLVDDIIERLINKPTPKTPLQLQILADTLGNKFFLFSNPSNCNYFSTTNVFGCELI